MRSADPAMWVQSRQYTGRVVTVSNAKVFEEPVFNYSHEFPHLWEEMSVSIRFDADRKRAEEILLDAAQHHAVRTEDLDASTINELKRRYFLERLGTQPRVYYRLTASYLELTVRFVVRDRGIRDVKDAMSRDMLHDLEYAGIAITAGAFEVSAVPPLRVEFEHQANGLPGVPARR